MRVVLIEDELVATRHLHSLLEEVNMGINIVSTLDSIEASVRYFSGRPEIDLILMDIELGDGQSFEIFKQVNVNVQIIFTTAYEEHALKAFKLNSVDYLLKPVDKGELIVALEKYSRLQVEQRKIWRNNILSFLERVDRFEEVRTRYLAKAGTRLISVLADDIAYFYTKDRLQYIKTVRGEDFMIDKRLDEIESEADPRRFFRVNRQFVLSYGSIQKVHAWFSGKLKVGVRPEAYEEIIISRLKAADFKKWLGE